MPLARHKSFFVDEELVALQRAFDAACAALSLSEADLAPRERVGALLFEIAQAGERDEAILKAHAVRRFRTSGAVCSDHSHGVTVEILAPVPPSRAPLRPDP